MREVAELLAGWIHAVQITSVQQWVLRLTVLGSGVGVAVLCALWFPVLASTALLVIAVVLALASALRPASMAPLLFVAIVGVWWLAGGAGMPEEGGNGGSPWRWLVTAALVAVFHLSTAVASAAPSYARITGRAAGLLSRSVGGYVAVSGLAGAAVLGLTALPTGFLGLWWVVVGVLALGTATVALVAALRHPHTG